MFERIKVDRSDSAFLRGGKIGLFAPGVGKTVIVMEIINTCKARWGSSFRGVGERTREGNDLLREMVESRSSVGETFNSTSTRLEVDLSKVDIAQLESRSG